MKKRLGIIGMDDVFFNKARIILRDMAIVERVEERDYFSPEEYDVLFTSTYSEYARDPRFITFGEGGDFSLPCVYDDVIGALNLTKKPRSDRPLLYLKDKCAYLGDKEIALTKKEAMLLKILIDAKGCGITNTEIQEKLHEEFGDYNSLKVYVNYLRKKLEAEGDKIIFSSRIPGGCKYTIHDKYWRVR